MDKKIQCKASIRNFPKEGYNPKFKKSKKAEKGYHIRQTANQTNFKFIPGRGSYIEIARYSQKSGYFLPARNPTNNMEIAFQGVGL